MPSALPTRVDLRPRLPLARDQKKRSTCLAFAVTAAHEVLRANESCEGEVTQFLSEEYLYWGCKQIDKLSCPETTMRATDLVLQQVGQPLATSWPYDATRLDEEFASAPAPDVDSNLCFKAKMRAVKSTEEELKEHLAAGRAVVLIVDVDLGFISAAKGLVPVPSVGELNGDPHAVLLVGYDDDMSNGCWIFRNSWGPRWGDAGYGYLPYGYIARHGGRAWLVESL